MFETSFRDLIVDPITDTIKPKSTTKVTVLEERKGTITGEWVMSTTHAPFYRLKYVLDKVPEKLYTQVVPMHRRSRIRMEFGIWEGGICSQRLIQRISVGDMMSLLPDSEIERFFLEGVGLYVDATRKHYYQTPGKAYLTTQLTRPETGIIAQCRHTQRFLAINKFKVIGAYDCKDYEHPRNIFVRDYYKSDNDYIGEHDDDDEDDDD
jgi:hypothetical protein